MEGLSARFNVGKRARKFALLLAHRGMWAGFDSNRENYVPFVVVLKFELVAGTRPCREDLYLVIFSFGLPFSRKQN